MLRRLALATLTLSFALGCSVDNSSLAPTAIDIVPTRELPQFTNVPEFATLQDAIDYATQEDNLLGFEGIVMGSESFDVELPSGGTAGNWRVNCFYRAVFHRFGEEAYPFLTPLLDHEHTFVQVGVHSVMNSAMYRHGLSRHTKDTREERVATMRAFQAILAAENAPE